MRVGPPGFQGGVGGTGFPGQQGFTGFPGPGGSIGITGFPGGPGAPGAPGQRGFTGPSGGPGFPGATGFTGPPGFNGGPGSPGATGTPGQPGGVGGQGFTGAPGAPGPLGATGNRPVTCGFVLLSIISKCLQILRCACNIIGLTCTKHEVAYQVQICAEGYKNLQELSYFYPLFIFWHSQISVLNLCATFEAGNIICSKNIAMA